MGYEVTIVERTEQATAVVCGHVAHDGIGGFLGPAFGEVMGVVSQQGRHPTGPPFARYRPNADGSWDIEAGFPIDGPVAAAGRVEPASLPAGSTAHTMHVGDYAGVAAAYEAVTAWLGENGCAVAGAPWECYLDGPEVAKPRTEVFFPCRPADT